VGVAPCFGAQSVGVRGVPLGGEHGFSSWALYMIFRSTLFAVSIIRFFYDDVGINVKLYRFKQVTGNCNVNLLDYGVTQVDFLINRTKLKFVSKINTD
jgi:hypothetical protein